jgi:hypothetical protein
LWQIAWYTYPTCGCGFTYSALDGNILRKLIQAGGRRFVGLLPIAEEWVAATETSVEGDEDSSERVQARSFYFGKKFTRRADTDMVTVQSGDGIIREMEVGLKVMFDDHRNDWLEHVGSYIERHPDRANENYGKWPIFQAFCPLTVTSHRHPQSVPYPHPRFQDWIGYKHGIPGSDLFLGLVLK